ncbi:MAG: hypothetical protein KBA46_01715, partial [Candidatus Omnitrophica bacterium]|nr:hypothetical protein [Candidatus Omnitrophota bacterium]
MFNDVIVLKTLTVLGVLFGSILILTAYLDWKKRKAQYVQGLGELWLRYLTFMVIAPSFLYFAYIGKPYFNFLVMLMAALYLKEFFHLTSVWQE